MKTLITIPHPELRKIVLSREALEKVQAISEVDWVEEGEAYHGPPLEKVIHPYDAVISGWGAPRISGKVLKAAQKLRFFGHAAGTVLPFIDIAAYDKGICIVNANAMLAASTAEFTLALMMAAAWDITGFRNRLTFGIWSDNDRQTVTGIEGQVVGIIGLGEISRRVIKLLKPWHPEILLHSSYCTEADADRLGVRVVPLKELLVRSQIITLHATLNETTRGMLGSGELSLIRDGSILINTARAAIIDEDALLSELGSGRFRAALDVYHREPLPASSPLLKMENVLCLPHIGGFSSFWKTRLGLSVVRDLERWNQGKPAENSISREQFLRQTPR